MGKRKLTEDQIKLIFDTYNNFDSTYKDIAEMIGVSENTIGNVINGRSEMYKQYTYLRKRFDRNVNKQEEINDQLVEENLLKKKSKYSIPRNKKIEEKPQIKFVKTKNKNKKKSFSNKKYVYIKKADGSYETKFMNNSEKKLPKYKEEKQKIIKMFSEGKPVKEIVEKLGITEAIVKSVIVGAGLAKYNYGEDIIRREDLDNFRDNIIKVGQVYSLRDRVLDSRSNIPYIKMTDVTITGIYKNFASTDKGSFKYIDLYKAYKYNQKQSTSL